MANFNVLNVFYCNFAYLWLFSISSWAFSFLTRFLVLFCDWCFFLLRWLAWKVFDTPYQILFILCDINEPLVWLASATILNKHITFLNILDVEVFVDSFDIDTVDTLVRLNSSQCFF